MEKTVRIFGSPEELAEKFAGEIAQLISLKASARENVSLLLSGGSTPEALYSVIGDQFADSVNWQGVLIFWGDERCVPATDPESNFGMTFRTMLSKLSIPEENIHRIRGESMPEDEAVRYGQEIKGFTRERDGLPLFDLVILGIGEDGHTASIFPSHLSMLQSESICEVAAHPLSGQRRITVTGRVLNNADKVVFLATGSRKAEVVRKILENEQGLAGLPASCIVPRHGELIWLLDREAASLL